jgi:hypothetical protein
MQCVWLLGNDETCICVVMCVGVLVIDVCRSVASCVCPCWVVCRSVKVLNGSVLAAVFVYEF